MWPIGLVRQVPVAERILLVLLGVVLLPGAAIALADLVPLPVQLDFASYYLAAHAIAQGQSPYDLATLEGLAAAHGGLPAVAYLYPPALAVLLRPLAELPFPTVNLLWFGLNLLWLFLAVVWIVRLVPLPRRLLGLACLVAILTPAVHHTLELGQVNALLLVLISGALLAIGRQPRSAWLDLVGGALLACATMIKPFPAVLVIVLVARRRVRALLAYLLGVGLLALLGIIAGGGLQTTVEWATQVLPRYAGGGATPNNQSLEGAIYRLFHPTAVELLPIAGRSASATLAPIVASESLGLLLGYLLSGAVALASLWLLARRWGREPGRIDMAEMAFLLVTVLLVQPLVWYHYSALLLIAYGVSVPHAQRDRVTRVLVLVSAILIGLQRYWRLTGHLGTSLVVSFGTLGVGLLWLAFARLIDGRGGEGRDAGRASPPCKTTV